MSYQTTLVGLIEDSKSFQLLMDNSVEVFEQPVWGNYLTDQFTLDLDWKAIMGVMENSPAASVIDFSSGKPLAVRPTASKLNGELMTLGNKYQMSKRQIREFMNLQDNVGKMGINVTTLIDFLMPDLKRATLGPHKTIDRLFYEAISTGTMSLTNVNNPKGVIWNTALDWGISQSFCSVTWSTAATAKPLTDIRKVVNDWAAKGVYFTKMKMSRATFNNMVATTEFLGAFKFAMGNITEIKNQFLGVTSVNAALMSMDLPEVEIIDYPISVEAKDGSYTIVKPFADHRVSFSVDNNYGTMFRTYANEERSPNPVKSYAKAMNVLLSKYQDMDGNEFTESEFSAFPVLNVANKIAILKTDATS